MTHHGSVLGVWGQWAPPKACAHHWCRKRRDGARGTTATGAAQGHTRSGPAPLPRLQPADHSFSPTAGREPWEPTLPLSSLTHSQVPLPG